MTNSIRQGAGIFFICPEDNTALLLKRSSAVSEPGTWGLPGGLLEKDEKFSQAALRETIEELGSAPKGRVVEMIKNAGAGWKFVIFVTSISWNEKKIWSARIRLNEEHSQAKWFMLNQLPENLHSAISIIKT